MIYLTHVLNGLSFGAVLFLVSSGFTLAFGLMKVINIAHGSFFMLGAYIAVSAMGLAGSFPLALLAAAAAVLIVGMALEEILLRRFHLQDLQQILLTMGVALIVSRLCFIIWGGDPMIMRTPALFSGPLVIGEFAFPKYRIFIICAALFIGLVLWLILDRSSIGIRVRACIDDEQMASAMGVNTRLLYTAMFGFSAMLAGLGGALSAPYLGAFPGLDFTILPLALVVVIIGGLGSLTGAAMGSIFVGVVDSLGKAMFPEFSYFTIFVPMIVVLAIKPNGLWGRA